MDIGPGRRKEGEFPFEGKEDGRWAGRGEERCSKHPLSSPRPPPPAPAKRKRWLRANKMTGGGGE